MNSLGSSSKWPSYDSLPSTSSFILSESEQTEDEADIFSEGEGDSGRRKSRLADEEITFSRNYIDFPARSDPRPKSNPDESTHSTSASSPGAAILGTSSATPGDLAFAQKCADLQMFVRPLLELLHGLKTGRFDKGLTSFQQSVAIDRLQRILGILQKPEMGEKYLQNLLQIEMMLKMWFPRLAFQYRDTSNQTITPQCPPPWHQNQLHMPVKKRKLSWSDSDHGGKVPATHKRHQQEKHRSFQASTSPSAVSPCLPGSPQKQKTPEGETVKAAECSCRPRHEFTGDAGALSRPSCLCSKRENEISLPSLCSSPATQDSSVSSSDTIITNDSP